MVHLAFLRRLGLLILMALLSACQTSPKLNHYGDEPMPIDGIWLRAPEFFEATQSDYAALDTWQLKAKVGVKTPTLRESANLVWSYRDEANQLRIFGPLGAGAIKMEFDRYGVQLSDSNGVLHRGQSAEALLTKIVGWPIPVDALSYWLFGLPAPGHVYEYQVTDPGQLSHLRQLGWKISYSSYPELSSMETNQDSQASGWQGSLARKLTAVKQLSDKQAISVKLVTKAWLW